MFRPIVGFRSAKASLLVVSIMAAAALAQEALAQDPAAKAEKPAKPDVQVQKWEFGISVQAVGGPCTGLLGTFPVPMDWPEQQVKIVEEQMTPNVEHHSFRTTEGVKQMVFSVPQLNAGNSAQCFILFDITRQAQKPPADPNRLIIPKEPPGNLKKYLGVSPLIESTNAKVRGLARELTQGKESAWDQVRAIQEGVRDRVQFELTAKDKFKGVVAALRDGKADREDQAATFVAVCRAAKIPARMVWAMDYCYAEFYLERSPADDNAVVPQTDETKPKMAAATGKNKKVEAPKGAWYPAVIHDKVELGVCTDGHPITQKGDNFQIPEEKGSQRSVNFFLRGKGLTGGKPTAEFRRRRAD